MVKKIVAVTQFVEVEVDETKFDAAFMCEFREYMYPFQSIDDHIKHLAQLEARGLLDVSFVEGYGSDVDRSLGVKVRIDDMEIEIVEQ